MAEHHALGTAGGSRCVEQPGEIVRFARQRRRRAVPGTKRRIVVAIDGDRRRAIRQAGLGPDVRGAVRQDQHLRAGIPADPGSFPSMQLGVDRDRGRPDPPDAVEAFEILRAVGGEQRDAIARRHAMPARQMRTDGGGTAREGGVVRIHAHAGQQRRRVRMQARARRQPFGHIHRPAPSPRAGLFGRLEQGHVVGHRGAAHVEDTGELGVRDLHAFRRLAEKLHRAEHVH